MGIPRYGDWIIMVAYRLRSGSSSDGVVGEEDYMEVERLIRQTRPLKARREDGEREPVEK